MPQTCSICRNPHREAVDLALVAGEPYRHIASRYGTSTGALQRHKPHISQALIKAKEERESEHAESLIDQVHSLVAKAQGILDKAENQRTALVAVRELRGTLELLGKLTGELTALPEPKTYPPLFALPPGTHVDVGIHVDPAPGRQRGSNEINITPEGNTEPKILMGS